MVKKKFKEEKREMDQLKRKENRVVFKRRERNRCV